MRKFYIVTVIGILAIGGGVLYEKYIISVERVDHWLDPVWVAPTGTERVDSWTREDYWLTHEPIMHTTPERAAVIYEQLQQGERSMNGTEFLGVAPGRLFRHHLDAPRHGIIYVSFVEYHGPTTTAPLKDYASVFKSIKMIEKGNPLGCPLEPRVRIAGSLLQ